MGTNYRIDDNKEAVNFILKAVKAGAKDYLKLAKQMNHLVDKGDKAMAHPGGLPWDNQHISKIARAAGYRVKSPANGPIRKTHKVTKTAVAAPRREKSTPSSGGVFTKWDLLQSIERCEELSASARKALLGMVFTEVTK